MDKELLFKTAAAMVAKGRGILAADESSGTCEKRFKSVNVESTEENRRAYRNLLFSTPGIEQFLSGVILFDETARQKAVDGTPIPDYLAKKGIVPGIKVDKGTVQLPLAKAGELVTEGLDGLSKRLDEYFKMGCRFAKWRAVITIGQDMPSPACIRANAEVLARYAAACQAASIVPMIEPEVLLDGNHTVERSEEVHLATLQATYEAVARYNAAVESLILKTSMVVSGKENARQAGVDEVAERTVRVLKNVVPAKQPGIVFLSGGQSDEAATAHLNAMAATRGLPWPLTFSYSRALQNAALKTWKGQAGNVAAAQKAFHHRAQMNALAAQGKWKNELERQAA
ncbi:MAG TPA: class I fructose-bisphosphate aldolase [Burkholderiales bacterium]|jgi:fructose-bisphosphate aldolase class I